MVPFHRNGSSNRYSFSSEIAIRTVHWNKKDKELRKKRLGKEQEPGTKRKEKKALSFPIVPPLCSALFVSALFCIVSVYLYLTVYASETMIPDEATIHTQGSSSTPGSSNAQHPLLRQETDRDRPGEKSHVYVHVHVHVYVYYCYCGRLFVPMKRRSYMNQALSNLLTRRSIRSYEDRQVEQDKLDMVLEAGTYAPTAMGRQSPCIVVVQDKETVQKLNALNAKVLGNPDANPFYGAPTVLVVFSNGSPNGVQDASLVMGNLMNAAHAVGLGSCWINRAKEVFEMPEGRALMQKWGVPENFVGVGNCILGYTRGDEPTPIARREGYIIRT